MARHDGYDPLFSVEMTKDTFESFMLVYGQEPRCDVCGKVIEYGDRWRWFVPSSYQSNESRKSLPVPAFGCATGHEGAVISVEGRLWRICEDGQPPEDIPAHAVATR